MLHNPNGAKILRAQSVVESISVTIQIKLRSHTFDLDCAVADAKLGECSNSLRSAKYIGTSHHMQN